MRHSHYKKPVTGLEFVDVYRVLSLFGVTDPCLQHAVKKLLVAGGRGAKDISQDVQEAIDTLHRWQEMRRETATMPATFGQQHMIDPVSVVFFEEMTTLQREPHQPRHRCLACAGGHSTHQCGADT